MIHAFAGTSFAVFYFNAGGRLQRFNIGSDQSRLFRRSCGAH